MTYKNPVLERLEEQREDAVRSIDTLLGQVNEQERSLSDAERLTLETTRATITKLDESIKPLREFEELRGADSAAMRPHSRNAGERERGAGDRRALGVQTNDRGHEYRTAGEAIVDRLKAAPREWGGNHDEDAAHRLRMAGAAVPGTFGEQERAVAHQVTGDTPGLLPKPIVGAIVNDLDAARPFMSSVGVKDLGQIPGKVFSRPTITQHVTVGEQTAEKTELPSRKMVVGGIDFTKRTFGGALNVSRQEIDWTSPAAWDALITDLQEVYAIETEAAAVEVFEESVTQATSAVEVNDLEGWATELYLAAALAYGGSGRMPNAIWVSLDMWAKMGAIVDVGRRVFGGASDGSSSLQNLQAGNVFDLPRTVVPSLPDGTVIVGVKERAEVYEERIGLLSAVQPSLLGIEIAYGGYAAFGNVKPGAFAKVTPPAPVAG